MKILCLIDSLGPGGAQRQLAGLATMLAQNGFDVKAVAWIRRENDYFYHSLKAEGVAVEYVERLKKSYARFWNIRKLLKKEKPDVVISYYKYMSVFLCLNRLLSRKHKLVISERSTTQKLSFYEKVRMYLLRFADAVVPNSESQATFIRQHYPKLSGKITVITNFTDTDLFKRSEAAPLNVENRCLVVGRLTPPKNTLTFIRAIHSVIERGFSIKVDWYGHITNTAYYQQCKELCTELGLDSTITFHLPTTNIVGVYENTSFFCLPSLYEGYPNVICEAMSCSLPIICSNVCDNAYIIEYNVNGFLFNPKSENDIADKLIQFLSLSDDEKRKMGQASRRIAEQKFSMQAFISKYINLIHAICYDKK